MEFIIISVILDLIAGLKTDKELEEMNSDRYSQFHHFAPPYHAIKNHPEILKL